MKLKFPAGRRVAGLRGRRRHGAGRSAALGGAERHPDAGPAFAEPRHHECHPDAFVRRPDALQRQVRGRAGAGHQVDDDQPDAGALRTAQGRQVRRRQALHRRRRDLLLRPHQAAAGHDGHLRRRHRRHQEDRRPHGRLHAQRPDAAAAAQHHRLPHHEQGVGGEEQDHQRAGLQGQGRQLRLAQRQRHRLVQDHRLDSPTSASRWWSTRTGGTRPPATSPR